MGLRAFQALRRYSFLLIYGASGPRKICLVLIIRRASPRKTQLSGRVAGICGCYNAVLLLRSIIMNPKHVGTRVYSKAAIPSTERVKKDMRNHKRSSVINTNGSYVCDSRTFPSYLDNVWSGAYLIYIIINKTLELCLSRRKRTECFVLLQGQTFNSSSSWSRLSH